MPWLDETGSSFPDNSLLATQGAGAVAGRYLSNGHDRARSAISFAMDGATSGWCGQSGRVMTSEPARAPRSP